MDTVDSAAKDAPGTRRPRSRMIRPKNTLLFIMGGTNMLMLREPLLPGNTS
jgi:hypothetical protein